MTPAAPPGAPRLQQQAGAWLGSRALNGAIALAQVAIVARTLGPAEAGRFFLVWTAAWLLATVLRFGADGILPRAVAEAAARGEPTPAARSVFGAGALAGLVALPILLLVLRVPLGAGEIALTLALGVVWAPTLACAALLKAHGRADLSGAVANVIWPLGSLTGVLAVVAVNPGWQELAGATVACGLAALLASVVLTVRAVGSGPVRRLMSRSGPQIELDRDAGGAAVLALLYELVVWTPVLLAALVGASEEVAAAVFAAARLAGIFSWGYSAVVAAVTPRIAAAIAEQRIDDARQLLFRSAALGTVLTIPVAIPGMLLAEPLLRIVDPAYASAAAVLSLLIAARFADAAAGPVGEALYVGRRTWLDASLLVAGMGLGASLAILLEPEVGTAAIGIGAAAALAMTNVLRIGVVARLLSSEWQAERRLAGLLPSSRQAGYGVVVAGCAISAGVLAWGPAFRSSAWVVVIAGALVAAGTVWFAAARHGLRAAVSSPLAIVAAVAVGHFALRPATLIADPESATRGLRLIGFRWADLMTAGALGAGALGAFALAFILAWRPAPTATPPPLRPSDRRVALGVLALLGAGSALWGLLFVRLGGPAALERNASDLHLSQYGGGYGTLGLMLCLSAALVALWAWLHRPSRLLLATTLAAAATGVAGSLALATRGPLMVTVLAGFSLVLAARRPRPRRVVAGLLVVVCAVAGMLFVRAIRDYSQTEPLSDAVTIATQSDPLRLASADLIEFDHLVALERAVPETLPWLDGESVLDSAAVVVPRAIWPQKPLPVDQRLSEVLYGEGTTAGTPFTLPGELWWNFHLPGALAAIVLLGLLAGRLWEVLTHRATPLRELVAALLFGYAYLLLTRPMAPMVLTTGLALTALAAAALATGVVDHEARLPRPWRRLRARRTVEA